MSNVALCFWGICRTTDQTIQSIEQFIYRPLSEANINYTTYVHTLAVNKPYKNARTNEETDKLNNELYKLLKPTEVLIEDQETLDAQLNLQSYRTKGDPWAPGSVNFSTLDNHIRALYSLSKVTQMALSKDHNVIIFLRPDVLFLQPILPSWIHNLKPNTILLPDFHTFPVNDRFAIASRKTAETYGLRFSDALIYSQKARLHSETFLKACLVKEKVKIILIKLRFRRVRVPNIIVDQDIKP
jgi:hypothetical protein